MPSDRRPSDRQFDKANAAIERAVATFISTIERMEGRWESVAPTYVIERVLLELCHKLAKLIDDPAFENSLIGPAEVKLSNALTTAILASSTVAVRWGRAVSNRRARDGSLTVSDVRARRSRSCASLAGGAGAIAWKGSWLSSATPS